MISQTEGIVISTIKYSETSIITKILTKDYGILSFLVPGVRVKSQKSKSAFYQPLTLLSLVIYNRENRNLQKIKEVKCISDATAQGNNLKRNCISSFCAEFLSKILHEGQDDKELFEIIKKLISYLNQLSDKDLNSFPTFFLLNILQSQGLLPNDVAEFEGLPSNKLALAEKMIKTSSFFEIENANDSQIFYYFLKYAQNSFEIQELKSIEVIKVVMEN